MQSDSWRASGGYRPSKINAASLPAKTYIAIGSRVLREYDIVRAWGCNNVQQKY